MTAQHTPGPWKCSADSDETMNPAFLVTESNTSDWPNIVAEVNSEANARLIAAAPDLLKALQDIAAWAEQLRASGDAGNWEWAEGDKYSNARAAIARATHKEQT